MLHSLKVFKSRIDKLISRFQNILILVQTVVRDGILCSKVISYQLRNPMFVPTWHSLRTLQSAKHIFIRAIPDRATNEGSVFLLAPLEERDPESYY